MKAPRKQLAHVLSSRTLDGTFTSADMTSLAAYLLDEGRTGELSSLLRDVRKAWADRGFVEAAAYSAHALPESAKPEIERLVRSVYPKAERVMVTPALDPSLIGGLRLDVVDYQLDRSTKGQLQKFKALAFQGKE